MLFLLYFIKLLIFCASLQLENNEWIWIWPHFPSAFSDLESSDANARVVLGLHICYICDSSVWPRPLLPAQVEPNNLCQLLRREEGVL